MKKLLLFTALATAIASSVNAQTFQFYEYGKAEVPTRESFITNKWFDNIFFGAGIGAATSFGKEITSHFGTPTFDLNVVKWFSPTIGARIGYQQFYGKEGLNGYNPYQMGGGHAALPYKIGSTGQYGVDLQQPGILYYGRAYFNGALMWNLTQFFDYYKADRFYNISWYVGGGYSHLYDDKVEKSIGSENYDREITIGTGFYNTFRINDRWNITADLAINGMSSGYRTDRGFVTLIPSLSVGVSFNIFKTRWNEPRELVDRIIDAENTTAKVRQENDDLTQEVQDIGAERDTLQGELGQTQDNLAKTDSVLQGVREAMFIHTVYFELDKYSLTPFEQQHLTDFVTDILNDQPDHVFYLTGSADKGTGNFDHNVFLGTNRAATVKNFIIDNFGVSEDQVVIYDPVVSEEHMEASFDRCVYIDKE